MKLPREHLPSAMKGKAKCGRVGVVIVDLDRDNDPDEWCSTCRKIACIDCGGSGFMNWKTSGIYCQCNYGTLQELKSCGHPGGDES